MEILVTIAIFSVLVSITGYVYASALSRSRDNQRISDLQTIGNGLEQYYLDHKAYPPHGANNANLFLAKFQLERQSTCLSDTDKFLVPTYMTSIPEDPQKKFVLDGTPPNCSSQTTQAGQYLYIPVIANVGDSVKDFILAAKVERKSNWSINIPSPTPPNHVYQQGNQIFCSQMQTRPNCTHNHYLVPKKNN